MFFVKTDRDIPLIFLGLEIFLPNQTDSVPNKVVFTSGNLKVPWLSIRLSLFLIPSHDVFLHLPMAYKNKPFLP